MTLTRHPGLRLIVLSFVLLLLNAVVLSPVSAENGSRTAGLYDEAGVFEQNERTRIEEAIRNVELAGAPTVVYLRLLETEQDRAVRDAQQLMEDWTIESEAGAHDGLVVFFNLEPDDPDRGEFAIVAGEAHLDGGALPQSALNQIRDEMTDYLVDDQMAEAIVHGLSLAEQRLEAGPAEPGAFASFLERFAAGPISLLNVLGVGIAGLIGIFGWRIWSDRPRADHIKPIRTTSPPSDLHPTLAGALAEGSIQHHHVEAMLIHLAAAGSIQIEPASDSEEKANLRILDRNLAATPAEEALVQSFVDHATDDVLNQQALQDAQGRWSDVQDLVRIELEELGWFDPEASSRQIPLILGGVLAFMLGLIALLPVFVIDELWALVAGVMLMLVGFFLFATGLGFPRTSYEGERQAVPWRGYREGLRGAANEEYGAIDLDEAFPYVVTFGLVSQYQAQLEQSSEAGYVPQWLSVSAEDSRIAANAWFVYWMAFHTSVNYSTSASSGSVPGGAATGSGGAGGRF
jgi:uncharacterized protein (TIGR04222 family)